MIGIGGIGREDVCEDLVHNTDLCPNPHQEFNKEIYESCKNKDDKPLDLDSIKKEIEEIRVKVSNLSPEESANQYIFKMVCAIGKFVSACKEKSKSGYGWAIDKIKTPFISAGKWTKPYVLRGSYVMGIERSGEKNGQYEIMIKYSPTNLGKMLEYEEVRQGYRRTILGWQPYPRGTAWGTKGVEASMSNFLEKRYLSDRLSHLMATVDNAGQYKNE